MAGVVLVGATPLRAGRVGLHQVSARAAEQTPELPLAGEVLALQALRRVHGGVREVHQLAKTATPGFWTLRQTNWHNGRIANRSVISFRAHMTEDDTGDWSLREVEGRRRA